MNRNLAYVALGFVSLATSQRLLSPTPVSGTITATISTSSSSLVELP